MPLNAGATLGPYEIDAPLGAGGMGEVYLVEAPMTRRDDVIYEYACHEGNYGLENSLRAGRAEDKVGEQ